MSEKIYCKDCRFCENGFCHRMPPVLVSWHKDALFPKVDDFDWCGMAKLKEELEIKAKEEAIEYRRAERGKQYEQAFDSLSSFNGGAPVKVKELAEVVRVTDKAVIRFIKENWKDTFLRFRNGIVFATKDGENT